MNDNSPFGTGVMAHNGVPELPSAASRPRPTNFYQPNENYRWKCNQSIAINFLNIVYALFSLIKSVFFNFSRFYAGRCCHLAELFKTLISTLQNTCSMDLTTRANSCARKFEFKLWNSNVVNKLTLFTSLTLKWRTWNVNNPFVKLEILIVKG